MGTVESPGEHGARCSAAAGRTAGPYRDELGLLRGQLTNLRALLVLSILMTESADDQQILRLATSAAASLGSWQIAGFVIGDAWWAGSRRGGALDPELASRAPGPARDRRPGGQPGRRVGLGLPDAEHRGPDRLPDRARRARARGGGTVPGPGAGPADRGGGVQRPAARAGAGHRGAAGRHQRGAGGDGGHAAPRHGHPRAAHPGRGGRRRRGRHRRGAARPDRAGGRGGGPLRQPVRLGRARASRPGTRNRPPTSGSSCSAG